MRNRLKWYFDQKSNAGGCGDLEKIVGILNKTLSPHVHAKMIGNKAVIQCKNKTVWINAHCLVTGESATPL
jgi:hypothetical protein